MADAKRLQAYISGWVQGVGFRWFVLQRARPLGLTGWTRNLPDGRVQVVAEGKRESLEAFLVHLRQGPSSSRVYGIEENWTDATGEFKGFDVRY